MLTYDSEQSLTAQSNQLIAAVKNSEETNKKLLQVQTALEEANQKLQQVQTESSKAEASRKDDNLKNQMTS